MVLPSATSPWSARAERRLRRPARRGAFLPVDAARQQLALLSVADAGGQGRLYWLVALPERVIRDARFLAFGSRASHPLLDCLCESVIGRELDDACRLTPAQIESLLRDDPVTPAVPEEDLAFLSELLQAAQEEGPRLTILPKPVEPPTFQRKREQDWDERDRAWYPLSYLKKIGKVDAVVARVLRERLPGTTPAHRIDKLNDDVRVHLGLRGLPPEQLATIQQALADALRSDLHPAMQVEVTPL